MIVYDVVTGEILRFIPSDISITPKLTASVQEKLKRVVSEGHTSSECWHVKKDGKRFREHRRLVISRICWVN